MRGLDRFKYYFSNLPIYLIFYVTAKCNLKCKHCFNWQMLNKDSNNELLLAEINKITKAWPNIAVVNLCGGEPYLREDLPEIVSLFKKNSNVEIITIPSNGIATENIIRIAKKILKDNQDIYFRFSFSVDGLEELHDQIRNKAGAFKCVINTLKEFKKLKSEYSNFMLISNTCFMQSNQDSVLDVLNYLKKNDLVDYLAVTYIRGDVFDKSEKNKLVLNKYQAIIKQLTKLNSQKKTRLEYYFNRAEIITRKKVLDNLIENKRNFNCFALKRFIILDSQGNIRVCEPLNKIIGNLRENDYEIKNVLNNNVVKKEIKSIRDRECNCIWECAVRTGILFNPLEYFRFFCK